MPHYSDGSLAAVGDIVRGKGYNVKDAAGNLKEIVGAVVGIVPDSQACNIRVAYLSTEEADRPAQPELFAPAQGSLHYTHDYASGKIVVAHISLEYGQCDHFQLVKPVLRSCKMEDKPAQLRPQMQVHELIAAAKAGPDYKLFRTRGGEDRSFSIGELVDVEDGDEFACVPPATF